MEETYEEIVREWYVKMRPTFTTLLLDKYKNTDMRLADANNIYQDIFLAIHKNIQDGRIGTECDWRNYIIRTGLNMASKLYRKTSITDSADEALSEDGEKRTAKSIRISSILSELPNDEAEYYEDPQSKALLGEELTLTPEPCASIIRMTYFSNMSDIEIAEEHPCYCYNGKTIEVNAKAIKARRWLCMNDLIYRVKMAFYNAGIIDQKPVKRKRNG